MDCPADIAQRLADVGGLNQYGQPIFRVVWGADRLVPNHGLWHEMKVRVDSEREIVLPTTIVETRVEPKYLPANMWFLEKWMPPETYGSPETWGKLGEEIVGEMTVDTAEPYPHQGEYELCYPISSDLTMYGKFVPLNSCTCELLARQIQASRDFTLAQRKAAIEQREDRERRARIAETEAALRDACPAFYDRPTSFSTGPKNHKVNTGSLWVPPNYRN